MCLAVVLCWHSLVRCIVSIHPERYILLLAKPTAELAGVTLDEQASKVIILQFAFAKKPAIKHLLMSVMVIHAVFLKTKEGITVKSIFKTNNDAKWNEDVTIAVAQN